MEVSSTTSCIPSRESTSASKVLPPFRTDSIMAAPANRGIAAGVIQSSV